MKTSNIGFLLTSFVVLQVWILENLCKNIDYLYTQHTLSEFFISDMEFLDLSIFFHVCFSV